MLLLCTPSNPTGVVYSADELRQLAAQKMAHEKPGHTLEATALVLREALEQAFAAHGLLRGYVLDDQGHLRANVVVYVDGRVVHDRQRITERPDRPADIQ